MSSPPSKPAQPIAKLASAGWKGNGKKGEPRPKAVGGDRRSGRIEAHHDFVLAALSPTRDATIEGVRHTLDRQGPAFGFGTIQRLFARHGIAGKKRPPTPRNRIDPTS